MRRRIMKNILLAVLLVGAFIQLTNACIECEINGIKMEKASKAAGSMGKIASGSKMFATFLYKATYGFSNLMYGVTFVMSGIDMFFPGVIPENEPAYVGEMRAYFKQMQDDFGLVKNKISEVKNYVQQRSTEQIYSDYITNIHTMETFYNEYMTAIEDEHTSASIKEAYKNSFVTKYNQQGNNVDNLYTGLTTGDENLNIATNAIQYTEGDRAKVLEIMFEVFNVITMGIKHEALYHALKPEPDQIPVLEHRWESRLNDLQETMKDIDSQLVRNANAQMELDLNKYIVELKDSDKNQMAENLYTWFSTKYYWQDWFVLVYSSGVKGHDNHQYATCGSNTVSRLRLGGNVDKTIYMFHINKAAGSWMTQTYAKDELKRGPYSVHEKCNWATSAKCWKAQKDLRKVMTAVKPDMKMCGITKGIVILKRTKSHGAYGDQRIKVYYSQSFFRAYAFGPYGSSSTQENLDGYSINGKWTAWSPWTSCSATCGGGTQTRNRYCRNPVPQDGGRSCSGSGTGSKSCNTFSCFSKTFLTNEVENFMKVHKKKNNEDFAEQLRDKLKDLYPEYRFSVNVYDDVTGSDKNSFKGYGFISLLRKHGRSVVVGYTKKSKNVPSSAMEDRIEERIKNAVTNKKKEANKSRDLAWTALQNDEEARQYRIAMVLVVRFGNGLRSRQTTSKGVFFENFNAKGSHKSSLVVMLAKA